MINQDSELIPAGSGPPGAPAVFERRASKERLELLAQKGFLDQAGLDRALALAGYIPTAGQWRRFLDYGLLALGLIFSLSGIIFFFAFNWQEMHRFMKFGLIQAGIVACLGLAYYRGLDSLVGKAGLIGASVLVGALLAVQGQVYQSGADAYWLFLYWALFITAWVIIGLSGPLWFLWLVLLNLTLLLYGEQAGFDNDSTMPNLLAGLNGLALLLWELGQRWGYGWLQGRWEPRLIALATFIFTLFPTLNLVSEWRRLDEFDASLIVGTLLYLILTAAVLVVYTRFIHDLFMLTLAAFSLIVVITTAVGSELMEVDFDAFGLLLIGLIIIVQAALAVNWLQRVARSWEVSRG
jgi:uncharacterized membrane protein